MKRFTVSIPKELKERLDEMPEVNWPEVAKQAVLEKLAQLLKFEELEAKGELEDKELAEKVSKMIGGR